MRRIGKVMLIGGLALTLPVAAMAADLPEPPPVFHYPPPPEPESPDIYLRLDLGYKIYRPPATSFNLPALGYNVPGTGEFLNESLSPTGLIGFGIGWDPEGIFRTDLTLDYEWPGHFEGNLLCPSPCTAAPDPEYSIETANISAWTLLANGYIDFNMHGGPLVPYIGGGIGVSRLTTSNVAFVNPDGSTGTWTGMSTWNLAYALMAGVAYEVAPDVFIDANYRYVHLGNAMAMTSLMGGTPIRYDNINAHEIRLGIRYGAW